MVIPKKRKSCQKRKKRNGIISKEKKIAVEKRITDEVIFDVDVKLNFDELIRL